ncbi:hypothetical protein QLX08_001542 [Tetragonisca angustula]|uniref:Uncharacterized protein n=1 Tax=Tetragonisca angustula TaxID=166442 RepID=A0AAW1AHL9_9HYME
MPYQCNNSTSAGFSVKAKTWLPVHSDYKILNLETQRDLHITQYEKSVMVKKQAVVAHGFLNITVCDSRVLCVMRAYGRDRIFVLFGFIDVPVTLDAETVLPLPFDLVVRTVIGDSDLRTFV